MDWPIPSRMDTFEATDAILEMAPELNREDVHFIMAQVYAAGYADGSDCVCCEDDNSKK